MEESALPFRVKTYIIQKGDKLSSLASLYNISPLGLRFINDPHIFSADGKKLREGAVMNLPSKPLTFAQSEKFSADIKRSHHAIMNRGLKIVQDDLSLRKMASRGLQELANATSDSLHAWAHQYGTLNFSLNVQDEADDTFRFVPQLRLLLPFWDVKNALVFGQFSYHHKDRRNQLNFGLGGRHFSKNSMVGLNSFLDYDATAGHLRLGFGTEYWRDFLKFSLNSYFSVGKDRASALDGWDARAANGFDIRGDFYLPKLPEFGISALYEKYFGDVSLREVAGTTSLLKNPHSLTFGLHYTPIPLLSVSLDERFSSDDYGQKLKAQTRISLQGNYRLGVPFATQLDGEQIAYIRRISGSRYDLVQRNDDIILAYKQRKQQPKALAIKLKASPVVEGTKNVPVIEDVKNFIAGAKINWESSPELQLSEHCKSLDGWRHCAIINLPAYDPEGSNEHNLSLEVTKDDKKLFSGTTKITVLKQEKTAFFLGPGIDPDRYDVQLTTDKPIASIHDKNGFYVFLQIKDKETGEPVSGLAEDLSLDYEKQAVQAMSGLVEDKNSPGTYMQQFRGLVLGKQLFTPAICLREGVYHFYKAASFSITFNNFDLPSKVVMNLSKGEIWQKDAGEASDWTEIAFRPLDEHDCPIYYGTHIDFLVFDRNKSLVTTLKAVRMDGTYKAMLSAQILPFLLKKSSPYIFTIVPSTSGLDFSKIAIVRLKVYSDHALSEQFDAHFMIEKPKLYMGERTKIWLKLEDKVTQKPISGAASDLYLFLGSHLRVYNAAGISTFVERNPGLYEAVFEAGRLASDYFVTAFYKEKEIANLLIKVCAYEINESKSRLFLERDNIAINDKKGIGIIFAPKDGCGFGLRNFSQRFRFVIEAEENTKGEAKPVSSIEEIRPGVYRQYIKATTAGTYLIRVYAKDHKGNEKELLNNTIAVHFTFKASVKEAKLNLSTHVVGQRLDFSPDFPNTTHIVFTPTDSSGKFVFLGYDVAFLVRTVKGDMELKIPARLCDASYEADFNALDLKLLPSRDAAYDFYILPLIANFDLPFSVREDLQVYAQSVKFFDLDAKLTVEKNPIYHGTEAEVLLSLKHKYDGKPFILPLSDLDLSMVSMGEKTCGAQLGALTVVGEGLYKAPIKLDDNNCFYKITASFQKVSIANLKVHICSLDFDKEKSQLSVLKDTVPLSDPEGIEISFSAKNACGEIFERDLTDALIFETLDKNNNPAQLRDPAIVELIKPGVYRYRVKALREGTYKIRAYLHVAPDKKLRLNDEDIIIYFTKPILPENVTISTQKPEIIYRYEDIYKKDKTIEGAPSHKKAIGAHSFALSGNNLFETQGLPYATKIQLSALHNDGRLAYLGENVAFHIKTIDDNFIDEIVPAHFQQNGYEAVFSARALKAYRFSMKPYEVCITPMVDGSEYKTVACAKLLVHLPLPKASSLSFDINLRNSTFAQGQVIGFNMRVKGKQQEALDFAKGSISIDLYRKHVESDSEEFVKHVILETDSDGLYSVEYPTENSYQYYLMKVFYGKDCQGSYMYKSKDYLVSPIADKAHSQELSFSEVKR